MYICLHMFVSFCWSHSSPWEALSCGCCQRDCLCFPQICCQQMVAFLTMLSHQPCWLAIWLTPSYSAVCTCVCVWLAPWYSSACCWFTAALLPWSFHGWKEGDTSVNAGQYPVFLVQITQCLATKGYFSDTMTWTMRYFLHLCQHLVHLLGNVFAVRFVLLCVCVCVCNYCMSVNCSLHRFIKREATACSERNV